MPTTPASQLSTNYRECEDSFEFSTCLQVAHGARYWGGTQYIHNRPFTSLSLQLSDEVAKQARGVLWRLLTEDTFSIRLEHRVREVLKQEQARLTEGSQD